MVVFELVSSLQLIFYRLEDFTVLQVDIENEGSGELIGFQVDLLTGNTHEKCKFCPSSLRPVPVMISSTGISRLGIRSVSAAPFVASRLTDTCTDPVSFPFFQYELNLCRSSGASDETTDTWYSCSLGSDMHGTLLAMLNI